MPAAKVAHIYLAHLNQARKITHPELGLIAQEIVY